MVKIMIDSEKEQSHIEASGSFPDIMMELLRGVLLLFEKMAHEDLEDLSDISKRFSDALLEFSNDIKKELEKSESSELNN